MTSTSQTHRPLWLRAHDFLIYRLRPLRGWLKHTLRRRLAAVDSLEGPLRLHIGCGSQALEGWVNLDIQKLPEVDVALDVRAGLPFSNAEFVFAEHFLEHLQVDTALDFLLEIHGVLQPEGWVRLSTPNIDWVWREVYCRNAETREDKLDVVIDTNRAFYGWRHRFLWDQAMLEEALTACGFSEIRFCRYAESEIAALRGLERHPRSPDTDATPHVLIAEARKGVPNLASFNALKQRLAENFVRHRDVL